MVMTCVYTALMLRPPSGSVLLPYTTLFRSQVPAANEPALFTGVSVTSQLSVATGACDCAVARPEASLHSRVISSEEPAVVHVGACVSSMVMTWVYTALTLPAQSVTVHVLV